MNNNRLTYLLNRIRQDRATTEEYRELRELINADESGDIIQQVNAFHNQDVEASKNVKPYNFPYWSDAVKEILQVDKMKEVLEHQIEMPRSMEVFIPGIPVHRIHFLKLKFLVGGRCCFGVYYFWRLLF